MLRKKMIVLFAVTLMLAACAPTASAPAAPASTQAPAAAAALPTAEPVATAGPAAGAAATVAPSAPVTATEAVAATVAGASTSAITATQVMTATPAAATTGGQPIPIGLIVKTETNPYFVTMIQGAQQYAAQHNVKLITASGNYDGDNATQITAIENMVNAGVKGILITPNDSKGIVPSITKARQAGVVVVALDTPTEPQDATDGLFATDNMQAGQLGGQYAKAAAAGKTNVIAMLDGTPGTSVSELRHNGWLQGFGIKDGDSQIVCTQATNGDQSKAQTAMENCLSKSPNINMIYTINEPAAFGAYTALTHAGKTQGVITTSIDGSCAGVRAVKAGQIDADSMQFPVKMATMGIDAIIKYAQTGVKPTGYVNTGTVLITDKPMPGVDSKDSTYGLANCWGK
jgi:fructose transport system substrate-binding protein